MLELLRIKHYIKNLFIFAPFFFSFSFDMEEFFIVLLIFILFSSLASSIYIFNDIMDIKEDKNHPIKKLRALASGRVSIKNAKVLFILLALISFIGSFLLNLKLFWIFLLYFGLNIAYSIKLKHIAIIDIFIIAIGFVLRLFAGASMLETHLSMWIIIVTFMLALFLGISKRRDDVILAINGKETRRNIDGYNFEFINATMVLMSAVVIVSYIFYTLSPSVIEKFHNENLYLTSLFVILGILRYMQITLVEQNSASPTELALTDKFLQITIVLWILSFIVIVKFL